MCHELVANWSRMFYTCFKILCEFFNQNISQEGCESVANLSPRNFGKLNFTAEAIRTTVVPISGVIRTTVVPISGVIGPTVVRIANATGIGYRHDGGIRFSNKLTYALNF